MNKARGRSPIRRHTMAEQMAESIQASILSGDLAPGANLPTEPELAEEFGVSRAVVRDATRILMARGLVNVVHGRGVYVTEPHNEAFGEALFLALRRGNAMAWDVEQFEGIMLPAIAGLAAEMATDEELAGIRQRGEDYIRECLSFQTKWWGREAPESDVRRYADAFRGLIKAVVLASHNRVAQELAGPLLRLHGMRMWADDAGATPVRAAAAEARWVRSLTKAVAGRDAAAASSAVALLMRLPPQAVAAMKRTPVGEMSVMPIPLPGAGDEGG